MEDACRIGSSTIRNISYGIIIDLERMFVNTYIELGEFALVDKPKTTLIDITAAIIKVTWRINIQKQSI